jgi:hypothetical protein
LLAEQHRLLAALWQRPGRRAEADASDQSKHPFAIENVANNRYSTWTFGLKAYQSNAFALAPKALTVAYPVMAQILGADSFGALARHFWHTHPPQRGDLGHWGEQLSTFVAASEQLADTPYLADVARVEWALHSAQTAADATLDAASVGLLAERAPDTITLAVSPGSAIVKSPWPVATLVLAHEPPNGNVDPEATERALSHAFGLIGQGKTGAHGECALIWRQGFKPRLRAMPERERAFVSRLLTGASLGQALDAAHDSFDFNAWLSDAVPTGLFVGVRPWLPPGADDS